MIRKKRYPLIILLIILFFFIGGKASAETYNTEIFIKIDSLYHARNYNALENYALRTLQFSDSLTSYDYAAIHRYLGIIYIIEGRDAEGRDQFKRWLKYEPNGFLDSFSYPPHIVRIFQEIKAETAVKEPIEQTFPTERWKPNPSSTIKSLLIPGLGQYEKNEKKKGALMFLMQTTLVAGWLVTEHNFELADRAYHQETNITRFDERYDEANNWNKVRWASVIASVAAYIFIQTDFQLNPPLLKLSDNISISNVKSDAFTIRYQSPNLFVKLPLALRIDF